MKNTIIITILFWLLIVLAGLCGCASSPEAKRHGLPGKINRSKFEQAVERRLSATEEVGNPVNRRILWTLVVKYQESKGGH